MKKMLLSGAWVESKYSTSWILALLLVANYTGTGFLVVGVDRTYGFESHLYDFVSSSFMGLTMITVAFLLSKTRLTRVRKVLAVWLLTATVSLIPIGLLVHLGSSGKETALFIAQSPNHVLSVFASCYLFSLLSAAIAEGASRSRDLRKTYSELRDVQRKLSVELDELAATYSKPIGERLRAFAESISKDKSRSPQSLGEALFEFSGKDLRSSVSEMISQSATANSRRTNRRLAIGFKATAAFTKLSFSQSLGVFGTTLLAAAYFAPSYFLIGGPGAALAIGASLAVALVIWLFIALLVGKRTARWWIWALANGGIYFASVDLAWPLAVLLGADIEESLVVATAGLTALLAMVLSSLESLVVRRKKLQEALVSWNESLVESSTVLNQRLNLVRTNLAKHLHNNVQSQLVALALKLKALGENWPTETSDTQITRTEALQTIASIGQVADQTKSQISSFESSLTELKDFWQGALKVSIDVTPDSKSLLNTDAALSSRVLKVLRECLTNAAKHSVDGSVTIKIALQSGKIQLVSSNKVSSSSAGSKPTGLGTKTLQESTLSWKAKEENGQYLFEATF
jgi:signal transduction histidine kinase